MFSIKKITRSSLLCLVRCWISSAMDLKSACFICVDLPSLAVIWTYIIFSVIGNSHVFFWIDYVALIQLFDDLENIILRNPKDANERLVYGLADLVLKVSCYTSHHRNSYKRHDVPPLLLGSRLSTKCLSVVMWVVGN